MNIKEIGNWLAARLKERSTYVGLVFVLTSIGVTISPDLQEVIAQIGTTLAGVILILVKDKVPPVLK